MRPPRDACQAAPGSPASVALPTRRQSARRGPPAAPVGSSAPRPTSRRKATDAPAASPVTCPEAQGRMKTRTSTNSLPPKRPPSPSPPAPKRRISLPPHLRPQKKAKRASGTLQYREDPEESEPETREPLTAYFLVFAQNMQLLLAMIGEHGSYMRHMAERYHLTHLSIESDEDVAARHGADLAGRFLYVLAGVESYVKRAVEDLSKVVYAFTGYRPSTELEAPCTLGDVDTTDYCPALFRAFHKLPADYVSPGCPPLARPPPPSPHLEAGPSTSASAANSSNASRCDSPCLMPMTLLDVSNAYTYRLPHGSVARLLRRDRGVTLEELATATGLSHLECTEDSLSMLLVGSVHAIRHACELLCSLIRSQTCFMPAVFETRLVKRLDPLAPRLGELLPGSSVSSDEGTWSSKVPDPSSATSVGTAGSPKTAAEDGDCAASQSVGPT